VSQAGRETFKVPALFVLVESAKFNVRSARWRTPRRSRRNRSPEKVWFIGAGVVLACCVIVALGVIIEAPLVRAASEGPTETPSVDVSTAALTADQSRVPTSEGSPTAGPAEGGRGDNLLKSDVWKSIIGFYASSRSCTDVTNTKIEVTQVPDSSGVWQEDWTVIACGQTEILKVKFTPSPQGGTDYRITQ
jgi:hypothetical protein